MAENRAKTPEKQEKTPLFRLVSVEKHRTSQGQTSVLLGQNLGTFPRRSPMFPSFRQKRPQKGPFRILQYFGTTRMPVAFEGLLSPLSAPHILLTYIKYTARHALHTASQIQHKSSPNLQNPTPILHLKVPANTGDLWHWCRKCRRFSKTLFYGGEYAFAPTYCRQRSPTQNETGTSAGDLCAKTLKTHRGRTKFQVVFR